MNLQGLFSGLLSYVIFNKNCLNQPETYRKIAFIDTKEAAASRFFNR